MSINKVCRVFLFVFFGGINIVIAQNPIIRNQFSADPTARVFNGKVYLFPSHDIPPHTNKNKENWFSMEDYHVFSSDNLMDWKDHGVIISQDKVSWVKPESFSMWAPDCVEKNGKYYFYFPSTLKENLGKGFGIGVAIAEHPEGPYQSLAEPIKGVNGIDPNVLIDSDGQAYLFWSSDRVFGAKLKSNMVELDSNPVIFNELPQKGHKEGPFVFNRNGLYYLTYPHVENKIERLEYAISKSPLGPYKVTGVIMDESPSGTWTNHHSIVEYQNQWYLFYHDNDYSPEFDKNRSVKIDSLTFNPDGTIQKVIPTQRGVGISQAINKIEIDRYSTKSQKGVKVDFLDSNDTFKGWKIILHEKKSFVQYNKVDFGKGDLKNIEINVQAAKPSKLEIRLDNENGLVLAEINVLPSKTWTVLQLPLKTIKSGIHNIVIVSKKDTTVAIDWLKFL